LPDPKQVGREIGRYFDFVAFRRMRALQPRQIVLDDLAVL